MQKRTLRTIGAALSLLYIVPSFIMTTVVAVTGLTYLAHFLTWPPTDLNDAVQRIQHYDMSLPESKEEYYFALSAVGLLYGVMLIMALCAWLFFRPAIRRFVAARKARTV